MASMRSSELLADAYSRIDTIVSGVLTGLEVDKANWRPAGSGNSIAWLIWHLCRSQDEQMAQVAGVESVWHRGAYAQRFAFDLEHDSTGYGHSTQQVDAVHLDSTDLLRQYHQAVLAQSLDFIGTLEDADLDRVVDSRWNPPVTLGVRLISIADDCVQHGGQAAYVKGLPRAI
ncbi:mycothiol transferase [Arthrobacter glacialis]|nr:DUF664 domain-containing protein [Arthrobacter glacialis]